ncbi:FAD-dependent monooxygenase [Spirosoma endbachense]|uniref:FAD-binding monooxygenase n=1 Tax=Spirosoma endbachense TaxID=2666025 RepID=A0A6P1W1F5_9BACT|nr:FAD-dependent monooxygenase [Spirosoma endbachense]QHV97820.1 FAD-binding monooxygenase [Spirosoma endbachense]
MELIKGKKVLISGASIAGLCTAWWMNNIGYTVTVVELASEPRVNGAAVELKGDTIDVVKRMGLFDQLTKHRLHVDRLEFKNAADGTEGSIQMEEGASDEIEIERDAFIGILYRKLKNDVTFRFNDSIAALFENEKGVTVNFKNSPQLSFHLVLGCDGVHSGVRKLWFGDEDKYAHFLNAYGSLTILPKLLIKQSTMQMYKVPGKSVTLNAYNNKTDIIFSFVSDIEIPYDYRNKEQQRQLILDQFTGQSWRTTELLEEMQQSDNFYFVEFYQIKMPSWTKGRVALVGDAAYCASPAAGMGGSLAMSGAAALADALQKHHGNVELAFQDYNKNYRPFIESVQAEAEQNLRTVFLPRTEEAIRKSNGQTAPF